MTEQAKFIDRVTREQRHQEVLANNAVLQARNTKLHQDIKELKGLTLWGFIKSNFFNGNFPNN